MLGLTLLHLTFRAFSTFLGSLGVFFVYSSFLLPTTAVDAIICLAAATVLVLAVRPD
jgi:hypothetical protein